MYRVKMNIFATRVLHMYLASGDSEGTELKDLIKLFRINDKLETGMEEQKNYILAKGENTDKTKVYSFDIKADEVRQHHWTNKIHPMVVIDYENAEYELLQSYFKDDSKLPREFTTCIVMISNALREAECQDGDNSISKAKKNEALS